MALLTAVPAVAKDSVRVSGPFEIRIFGANGEFRDFIARSADDGRGALALADQIAGAIRGPAQPIEEAAIMMPHYRIGISHLGPTYLATPWARTSETSVIYFPGAQESSFLVVEFTQRDAALEQRWISPTPEVAALLQRHLQGLLPIGTEQAGRRTATEPLSIVPGLLLLAGLSLMMFEDHRRWRLKEKRRSAGKGDVSRRSEGRRPVGTVIDSRPGYAR
jgi:hypothetical protein